MTLSDPHTSSRSPDLSIGASGNGLAAWVDDAGTGKLAPFINGIWMLPAIDVEGSSNASTPKVAVDSLGNSVVIWNQTIGAANYIMETALIFENNSSFPIV